VLCRAVLCCAVLCCAVLCCTVLYCAVLYCAVLCCAVLCCAVLCCAVLSCPVLSCAVILFMAGTQDRSATSFFRLRSAQTHICTLLATLKVAPCTVWYDLSLIASHTARHSEIDWSNLDVAKYPKMAKAMCAFSGVV
jgi:hypothetical protein